MNTQRLIEFAGNHLSLFLAFVALLILIIYNEVRSQLDGVVQLGPHAVTQAMNDEATVILDVREDGEYKQGHIANSVHIPLAQLASRLTELDKYRARTVIAYCRTGSRSNSAARLLRKQGFATVHNLAGGIVAWQNANLPVTKK